MENKKKEHSASDNPFAPKKGIPFPAAGQSGKGAGKTNAAPMSTQKSHFHKAPK